MPTNKQELDKKRLPERDPSSVTGGIGKITNENVDLKDENAEIKDPFKKTYILRCNSCGNNMRIECLESGAVPNSVKCSNCGKICFLGWDRSGPSICN